MRSHVPPKRLKCSEASVGQQFVSASENGVFQQNRPRADIEKAGPKRSVAPFRLDFRSAPARPLQRQACVRVHAHGRRH